jgi:hypothetical protein
MEGVERVYHTGYQYAKARYIPHTVGSVLSILVYTAVVFYLTEYLLRGRLTRWLYLGSAVMVISMIYRGDVTERELLAIGTGTAL